jgi:hypothetical protein
VLRALGSTAPTAMRLHDTQANVTVSTTSVLAVAWLALLIRAVQGECVFDCSDCNACSVCGPPMTWVNHSFTFRGVHWHDIEEFSTFTTPPLYVLNLSHRGITSIASRGLDCFFTRAAAPANQDDDFAYDEEVASTTPVPSLALVPHQLAMTPPLPWSLTRPGHSLALVLHK